MIKLKTTKVILILIAAVAFASDGYSQPTIPKEKIPPKISKELRKNIEQLYSSNVNQRVRAIKNLGTMGEAAAPAIPFLINLLTDYTPLESSRNIPKIGTSNMVRNEAIGALVKIGPPAVEPLISSLDEEHYGMRKMVAWALGEIGDSRAIDPLIAETSDPNEKVRYRAVEALGNFNDPRVIEPLCIALKDSDVKVRRQAARILAKKKDNRTVQPLISVLKDPNPDVRGWAIQALGNIGDERAIEPLVIMLKDKNNGVRYQAVVALGKFKELRRTVEPLISVLDDRNKSVRIIALATLQQLTGENFGLHPEEWNKWWDKNKSKVEK